MSILNFVLLSSPEEPFDRLELDSDRVKKQIQLNYCEHCCPVGSALLAEMLLLYSFVLITLSKVNHKRKGLLADSQFCSIDHPYVNTMFNYCYVSIKKLDVGSGVFQLCYFLISR